MVNRFLLFYILTIIFCGLMRGQVITTIAGINIAGYSGDGGQATDAKLFYASTVTLDGVGNIYFSDKNNNVIRKIDTMGIITTVAGNGYGGDGFGSISGGYTGDGGPATAAELFYPWAVAADISGNLFIADRANNVVRKVNRLGVISTFAGNGYNAGIGLGAYSGDGGPADSAELNYPSGVVVDHIGNVYIGDSYNNVIRKVDTAGIITTIAGNHTPGYCGDGGPATAACLSDPYGIALDAMGNVYIADRNNYVIRKVDTSGIITTVAGNNTLGYTGDGGAATSASCGLMHGVAVDSSGNVYCVDETNSVVRKVDPIGVISTYAGNGSAGYAGNGGPATDAELAYPLGIAIDAMGRLYIADDSSSTLRMVSIGISGMASVIEGSSTISLFPNPGHNAINIKSRCVITNIDILDIIGQRVLCKTVDPCHQVQIDISNLTSGVYIVKINGSVASRIIKE